MRRSFYPLISDILFCFFLSIVNVKISQIHQLVPGYTNFSLHFIGIDTVICLSYMQGGERGAWMQHLTFAVFGLGNRQYEHFNKVVLKFLVGFLARVSFMQVI